MKPYQEQNFYELLEVGTTASPAEIRSAYERAVETYSAESVAIYALEDPGRAEELREKLREAMEILTDHNLRVEYDRMIGLPPRPHAEEAAAPALAASELMASSEALHSTHPEVKVAYFPTPMPGAPVHMPPPQPVHVAPEPPPVEVHPPPAQRPARPVSAREIEGAPLIAEQEAIATAEAELAKVATVAAKAREAARETPRPRPVDLPPDAEFSGEVLRRVRESRGFTLQQIADRTRIGLRHLENIEADRYSALPVTVYLRGILMNLARELGLDQARVSKSYLQLATGKKS